jgi:competence protein ComEA
MPSVPDSLKPYRLYFAMFVLNLAIVIGVIYLLSREPARPLVVTVPPTRAAKSETPVPITVIVSGAVNHPGEIELPSGALLAEALQKAGVKAEADVSKLNLTRPLQDGDKINVPSQAPTVSAAKSPPTANSPSVAPTTALTPAALPTHKLNLNTATLEELDALPGIGSALAQRILDYRAQKGGFKSIDELKEIRGIGDTLFNQIKGLVTVE